MTNFWNSSNFNGDFELTNIIFIVLTNQMLVLYHMVNIFIVSTKQIRYVQNWILIARNFSSPIRALP